MKLFRRITLLSLFAGAGIGLALAVVATAPSGRRSFASGRVPQVSEAESHAPASRSPETTDGGNQLPESSKDSTRQAAQQQVPRVRLSVPAKPVIAEPFPPVAMQARPEDVEKAIRYLQERLSTPAGRPPEAIPAPLPGSLPAPAAPAPLTPFPGSAAAATGSKPVTTTRKNRITRVAPGEGDDHLTIRIQDTDIREVLEMLSEEGNLNILASNSVQGKVSATLNDVSVDSALAAILRSTGFVSKRDGKFIYVGIPDDFQAMAQAVDTVGTRVYHPNYLTAEDLKTLIMPLLTPKIGVCSFSAPSEVGIGTDDDKVGGNKFAGSDVILVRDYEAVLAQVDQVVSEVDVRPMQVAIEAMILSVKLDDKNKWGVSFQLFRDNPNLKFGWGTPLADLAKVDFTEGGLKFGFLDSDLGAFLSALESIGDTNVIATPRVLVLNKHRADILIGKEEGYISTTQTETARTQTVEFLDIGAQLRLRPFISSDGLIRMEVHPELSDGQVRELASFTVPQKDVTKVTTNIMVRDGCTVIIGGLMREQLQTTTAQVPFLGSLPVVGVAFRNVTEETKREEVIVLITPRIVHDADSNAEARTTGAEFERRQAVYAEKMSATGKRHVARCYLRMAREAWTCGDRERAMRFAELAVHFDPLNRDAIELRSQIWTSGCHTGPQILSPGAVSDPVESPLDGQTIAPWVIDGLQSPGSPASPEAAAESAAPKYKEIQRPRKLP